MSNNDDSEVEGGKNLTRTEAQEAKQQGRDTLRKGIEAARTMPRATFGFRNNTLEEWRANKDWRDNREDTRGDTREDTRRDTREDTRRDTRKDARRVTHEDAHRHTRDEYRDSRAGAFENSLNTSHYKEMYQPNGRNSQEGNRSARPDGR